MGYAFLFRNYRADTGKWLSQDLIGYPDGWNNFSYCGNSSICLVDLYGAASATLRGRDAIVNGTNQLHTSMHFNVTSNEYSQLSDKQKSYFTSNTNGTYDAIVSGFEESSSFGGVITRDTYLDLRKNDTSDALDKTAKIGDIHLGLFEGEGGHQKDITPLDFIKNYLDASTNYDRKIRRLLQGLNAASAQQGAFAI